MTTEGVKSLNPNFSTAFQQRAAEKQDQDPE